MTRTDSSAQSWFRSANCDGRYGLALSALLAGLLALAATGDAGRLALRYERAALAHHQWWRLLSAHLVHLNAEHALLDGAGLALIWVLFAREFSPRRWLAILLASAAAIDAGLWFLSPAVEWYLGASGVLHGALAAGAIAWYRRGDGMGAGLVVLLVAKLGYEQLHGTSILMADLPLVPQAHLYGALGGLSGAVIGRAHRRGAAKPL
jgi:rhomboid family GlyGly-CTERM serine protease